MFTRLYILLFLFIRLNSVGTSQTTKAPDFDNEEFLPRVVNGWPAKLGDVPYQVSFKTKGPRKIIFYAFCGGVIISPRKLLSAAHCFAKDPTICQKLCGGQGTKKTSSHAYAVAGNLRNKDMYSEDSPEHGQWRKIESVTYPKTYKFPKDDIAILFIINPFIFNEHVNAIPIATRFIDYHGKCLVSGYGRIGKSKSSSKLLLAHLDLLSIYKCNRKFRKNMKKFICTTTKVTDVGKGDSGGPLVCMKTGDPNEQGKGVLVGIVSGSKLRVASFFTRVSYFAKYIERNKACIFKPLPISTYIVTFLIHVGLLLF